MSDETTPRTTRRDLLKGLAATSVTAAAATHPLLAAESRAADSPADKTPESKKPESKTPPDKSPDKEPPAANQPAAPADGQVTVERIEQTEWITGIKFEPPQRAAITATLQRTMRGIEALRLIPLANEIPPAIQFHTVAHQATPIALPRPAAEFALPSDAQQGPNPKDPDPKALDDLAFAPAYQLAQLIRSKKISSVELTTLALNRLKKYDPQLLAITSLTEELALRQARRADQEIAEGKYRGPLHGIPWGAKDLIAVPGYPTTWGAPQFREQRFDRPATVVQRLEQAGAVLTCKLTVGALAWGDDWYGGVTKNPWNLKEGASGSSAGSCAVTAAGLLPFTLGSETLGSIVSPCTRCGVTGLRPTFGRVSRTGCMTLAWSMDKVGPIARHVFDCGLVFSAIHGADGQDEAAIDRPFSWPLNGNLEKLKVGYVDDGRDVAKRSELNVLKKLGVQLVPIELPGANFPVAPLTTILEVEAATAFDDLTRSGNTEGLNRWPDVFRKAEFIPAVEYLRANRLRTLLMREMEQMFQEVDLYVGGNDLVITNLTGHPTVVLPNGFEQRDGVDVPTSLTFTGRLFGEASLLAVAEAYQRATDFHLRRPPELKT